MRAVSDKNFAHITAGEVTQSERCTTQIQMARLGLLIPGWVAKEANTQLHARVHTRMIHTQNIPHRAKPCSSKRKLWSAPRLERDVVGQQHTPHRRVVLMNINN